MQPPQRIDHFGIAVRSLEEASGFYRDVLGLQVEGSEEIPGQKMRVASFRVGELHIELLEPTADDSPIARFLAKNGPGLHHLAYRLPDHRTTVLFSPPQEHHRGADGVLPKRTLTGHHRVPGQATNSSKSPAIGGRWGYGGHRLPILEA